MIWPMNNAWNRGVQAILMALEADEVSARGGFACVFSTSDEYETALISERRTGMASGGRRRRRHVLASLTGLTTPRTAAFQAAAHVRS